MITSVDNVRVKDVLRLRKGRERRRVGLLVAEGTREVERALAAGLVARVLYVAPELLPGWTAVVGGATANGGAGTTASAGAAANPGAGAGARGDFHERPEQTGDTPRRESLGSRVEEVSARVLAKMAYRAEPEGVLGVFELPRRELPADPTLILVAVRIEKPGNLGAMARTADAAGADALLVADAAADPWNPNAIRASTGAVFTLPILEATLDEVRALPMRKVAAVVEAPTPYTASDLTVPTALVVGAEAEGLGQAWRDTADLHVSVPMTARTADSLNAATTAAILLFEAVRQRSAA